MSTKQIILELREQDNTATNYETGDYEILLEEPLDLEDQDVITCKQAFIDTIGNESTFT